MTFIVRVHAGPDHLQVDGAGLADLAELCGFMDLVGTVAGKKGYAHAVLNLLDIEIALSFTDHLQLGSYAAERLRNLKRVASVVPERFRSGTSEKAAQKSGLQLRTFTSLEEGLAWLAEAGPAALR